MQFHARNFFLFFPAIFRIDDTRDIYRIDALGGGEGRRGTYRKVIFERLKKKALSGKSDMEFVRAGAKKTRTPVLLEEHVSINNFPDPRVIFNFLLHRPSAFAKLA